MFDVKLERVDALRPKMQKLDAALNQKLAREALSAGARKIIKRAKAIVSASDDPTTGRKIASNITYRYRRKYSEAIGGVVVSVGVATPKGKIPKGNPDEGDKGPTFHWYLLENGTEHMRAQPFLVPAAMQESPTLPQVIVDDLSKRLDKEVAKL